MSVARALLSRKLDRAKKERDAEAKDVAYYDRRVADGRIKLDRLRIDQGMIGGDDLRGAIEAADWWLRKNEASLAIHKRMAASAESRVSCLEAKLLRIGGYVCVPEPRYRLATSQDG